MPVSKIYVWLHKSLETKHSIAKQDTGTHPRMKGVKSLKETVDSTKPKGVNFTSRHNTTVSDPRMKGVRGTSNTNDPRMKSVKGVNREGFNRKPITKKPPGYSHKKVGLVMFSIRQKSQNAIKYFLHISYIAQKKENTVQSDLIPLIIG